MKKVALLFPGSGSQYVGMGKYLYDNYKSAKDIFEEADHLLDYKLSEIILKGNIIKLNKVQNLLPAIYVVNYAYYNVFVNETCFTPYSMAGHSLGEYSALTAAKSISFQHGLKIVLYRSLLAQEIVSEYGGTMTILKKVNPEVIDKICKQYSTSDKKVSIACFNTDSQVLISGDDDLVKQIECYALKLNDKTEIINLATSPPYHSTLMKIVANKFKDYLLSFQWNKPSVQVISNVTALPYCSTEEIINNLVKQLYSPVQWEKTMQYLYNSQVDSFIEIGPQNILKNFTIDLYPGANAFAFDEKMDRSEVIRKYNTESIIQRELEEIRQQRLKAISMCLTYSATTKNYTPEAIFPNNCLVLYNSIKERKKYLEKSGDNILDEDVRTAVDLMQQTFDYKNVPIEEQLQRKQQITERTGINIEFHK